MPNILKRSLLHSDHTLARATLLSSKWSFPYRPKRMHLFSYRVRYLSKLQTCSERGCPCSCSLIESRSRWLCRRSLASMSNSDNLCFINLINCIAKLIEWQHRIASSNSQSPTESITWAFRNLSGNYWSKLAKNTNKLHSWNRSISRYWDFISPSWVSNKLKCHWRLLRKLRVRATARSKKKRCRRRKGKIMSGSWKNAPTSCKSAAHKAT